jgi:hypothetical protein
MAVTLDAMATPTLASAAGAQSVSLTTAHTNELVVVICIAENETVALRTVTGVSGGGLTWTLRGRFTTSLTGLEMWSATAASPLSAATITATYSGTFDDAVMFGFGLYDPASGATPVWDSNAAVPAGHAAQSDGVYSAAATTTSTAPYLIAATGSNFTTTAPLPMIPGYMTQQQALNNDGGTQRCRGQWGSGTAGGALAATAVGWTAGTADSGHVHPVLVDAVTAGTPATPTGTVAVPLGPLATTVPTTTVSTPNGTASIPLSFAMAAVGTVSETFGGGPPCIRHAWLTLGSLSVPLQDETGGYFCTSLDLGFPAVREVVNNRPDRDGITDRTAYAGSRVVSAHITALAGAGARIDAVAAQFAPFTRPSARPVLHYVLDRPGTPERTFTLRGAGYSWPIAGPYQRDIQLQWVAADPYARDPVTKTVTATFTADGVIAPAGDAPVGPLIRITGPVNGPSVQFVQDAAVNIWWVQFLPSFTIAAGHFIDINLTNRTVYLDGNPAEPRLASLDWTVSSWQWMPPAPSTTTMSLGGSTFTGATKVQAIWNDGYLT